MSDHGRYGFIPASEGPHEVLGLPPPSSRVSLTDADVARAYRKASLSAHPDKPNGSQQKFERVKEAYEILKTAELRSSFAQYGSRLCPGPGDDMGKAVDKFIPLTLGIISGFVLAFSMVKWNVFEGGDSGVSRNNETNWANVGIVVVVSLGGGTAFSCKSPLSEVLFTGLGGLFLGTILGCFLRLLCWLFFFTM